MLDLTVGLGISDGDYYHGIYIDSSLSIYDKKTIIKKLHYINKKYIFGVIEQYEKSINEI